MNNKKIVVPLAAVIVLLVAGIVYLGYSLNQEKQVNKDMQELAVLEKQEMENVYQLFADQYSEMKTRINNDSIVAQLNREQQRTQQLLAELRQTKAEDAAEITRLKKELATVRAVLRSYVLQIDSLNQLNAELMDENNRVRSELEITNQQNMALASSNMTLSEKVAIASQLTVLIGKRTTAIEHLTHWGGDTNEELASTIGSRYVTGNIEGNQQGAGLLHILIVLALLVQRSQ